MFEFEDENFDADNFLNEAFNVTKKRLSDEHDSQSNAKTKKINWTNEEKSKSTIKTNDKLGDPVIDPFDDVDEEDIISQLPEDVVGLTGSIAKSEQTGGHRVDSTSKKPDPQTVKDGKDDQQRCSFALLPEDSDDDIFFSPESIRRDGANIRTLHSSPESNTGGVFQSSGESERVCEVIESQEQESQNSTSKVSKDISRSFLFSSSSDSESVNDVHHSESGKENVENCLNEGRLRVSSPLNPLLSVRELTSIAAHRTNKPSLQVDADVGHTERLIQRRRFPGPAGILPALANTNNFPSPDLQQIASPAVPYRRRSVAPDVLACSQNSAEAFTKGPWAAMMEELKCNEDEAKSIVNRWNINAIKSCPRGSIKGLVRKLPLLCVLILHIEPTAHEDVKAVFRDKTGEIEGVIHHDLLESYPDIRVGSALILYQAVIFSPSIGTRRFYLNVVLSNILGFWTSSGISQYLQGFDRNKIDDLKNRVIAEEEEEQRITANEFPREGSAGRSIGSPWKGNRDLESGFLNIMGTFNNLRPQGQQFRARTPNATPRFNSRISRTPAPNPNRATVFPQGSSVSTRFNFMNPRTMASHQTANQVPALRSTGYRYSSPGTTTARSSIISSTSSGVGRDYLNSKSNPSSSTLAAGRLKTFTFKPSTTENRIVEKEDSKNANLQVEESHFEDPELLAKMLEEDFFDD